MPTPALKLEFDNSYALELPGFYVDWQAERFPAPALLRLNASLAAELALDAEALQGPAGLGLFSGARLPASAHPLAQVYAGHQFGGFSPQLGDGRALLLGELIDRDGRRRDIQLKGAGPTPFSRGGDGKAAIGPVLREYLIGEAMHGLGIPTTRALAAVTTGEMVQRDRRLPGAVLTRVAASHIRVGTFQFFAARGEKDKVRRLADYAIARHYPHVGNAPNRYIGLLEEMIASQAKLIARWMLVGFVHGVMNTDNMTISGETIDYGPCAFMDRYDRATTFSSIDHGGRYAFGQQPVLAQWNLARFAETLLPFLDVNHNKAATIAADAVAAYADQYQSAYLDGMRGKLGLSRKEEGDARLASEYLSLLQEQQADFTTAFRALGEAATGAEVAVRARIGNGDAATAWLGQWRQRLTREGAVPAVIAQRIAAVNPIYIARNHKVEEALTAAEAGDLNPFDRLLDILAKPFDAHESGDDYLEPAAADAVPYRTFCGT